MTAPPTIHLRDLDVLWLQLTGTVCNIACRHCFISCGPKVERHRLLTTPEVFAHLDDAEVRGVREVWFTGGEPFLHPDILPILRHALARTAVGVLTNGMLIDAGVAEALGEAVRATEYNLEVRVSLDGPTADSNDRLRGRGVFDAAMAGLRNLVRAGIEPIVAVTVLDDAPADREAFVSVLRGAGVTRPRVKWIPPFRIGREARRGRTYEAWEQVVPEDLGEDAAWTLMCGTSRTITSQGVFPCPMLIDVPELRLGATLAEAARSHPVAHPACSTCVAEGFSCSR